MSKRIGKLSGIIKRTFLSARENPTLAAETLARIAARKRRSTKARHAARALAQLFLEGVLGLDELHFIHKIIGLDDFRVAVENYLGTPRSMRWGLFDTEPPHPAIDNIRRWFDSNGQQELLLTAAPSENTE